MKETDSYTFQNIQSPTGSFISLFPRELSVSEDQLSKHTTIRTWLHLYYMVIKSIYCFNNFTTGPRKVLNHKTAACVPVPALQRVQKGTCWGAATGMKRRVMMLLLSLTLASQKHRCLSNREKGGEGDGLGSPVQGSVRGHKETASGPAMEGRLGNKEVCKNYQHRNSLRADVAGWVTFNYIY